MKISKPTRASLGMVALALLAGCTGSGTSTPLAAGQSVRSVHSAGASANAARPAVLASGVPWMRVGRGAPKSSRIVRGSQTVLVSQSFAGTSTPKQNWFWKDNACLTAGTASTPKSSIPACGANAPQDPPGSGTLELTPPNTNALGLAGWHEPLPTANGLEISFNLYAFDGSEPGADGVLVFLSDGSAKHPTKPAGAGGALGYINHNKRNSGLPNAYLGVGFDEYGNFSNYLLDGPGFIPETVAFGGAESAGYAYLGGVTDGSGQPASLPFDIDDPSSPTRQSSAPTVYISLTASGLAEVAIDIHDGNGPVTYVSENIVGINGQPAVPSSVYVGFIASTGTFYNRQQIDDLTIETLQ